MKLIRNILLIATGLSMASCNYLDVNTDTKDRMSLEEVFTDETYTEQWLANAYSYLTNSEFADISITGSNPFNFSDDIYNPIYKSFKEVTYGEEQWPYTWKYSYQGIRQAAIFIQNVDMCNELTSEERADYKAQARFVRAYYYRNMVLCPLYQKRARITLTVMKLFQYLATLTMSVPITLLQKWP